MGSGPWALGTAVAGSALGPGAHAGRAGGPDWTGATGAGWGAASPPRLPGRSAANPPGEDADEASPCGSGAAGFASGAAFASGVIAFASGIAALAAGAGKVGSSTPGANESGQVGITWVGVAGSSSSDGGGHAGIALSVGGSGGQMSVSSGGAGADSDAGGHVDFIASPATDLNGPVRGLSAGGSATGASTTRASAIAASAIGTSATGASAAGASAGGASLSGGSVDASIVGGSAVSVAVDAWMSGIGSSGAVGTVVAHSGVVPAASPLGDVCDVDQSGSPFCIGRAGIASSSPVASVTPELFSAGSTGTVWAQTGVVSLVATGVTGSAEAASGGVESVDAEDSGSNSQSV